jgi:hypothetical protein
MEKRYYEFEIQSSDGQKVYVNISESYIKGELFTSTRANCDRQEAVLRLLAVALRDQFLLKTSLGLLVRRSRELGEDTFPPSRFTISFAKSGMPSLLGVYEGALLYPFLI